MESWQGDLHCQGNPFPFERLEGKDAMAVLLDGLSHFKQPYWLSAGTLLGLERDNQLIPHDTDIDIAVLESEEVTLPDEYKPIRFITLGGKPMQRAYLHEPTKIIFDIFHYYKYGDVLYNTQDAGSIRHLISNIFPLRVKEYLGHKFCVPTDIDAHLTEWYGDWRTPVEGGKTEWVKL